METAVKKLHSVTLDARKKGVITGVEKVVASCETALTLITSEGNLVLTGKDFKINKFNLEDGTLGFDGSVDSLRYAAKKQPVLKRLFR